MVATVETLEVIVMFLTEQFKWYRVVTVRVISITKSIKKKKLGVRRSFDFSEGR